MAGTKHQVLRAGSLDHHHVAHADAGDVEDGERRSGRRRPERGDLGGEFLLQPGVEDGLCPGLLYPGETEEVPGESQHDGSEQHQADPDAL